MKRILIILILFSLQGLLFSSGFNILSPSKYSIKKLNVEFKLTFQLTEANDYGKIYIAVDKDTVNYIGTLMYNSSSVDEQTQKLTIDTNKIRHKIALRDTIFRIYFIDSRNTVLDSSTQFFIYDTTDTPNFVRILKVKNINTKDLTEIQSSGAPIDTISFTSNVKDSILFEWVDDFPEADKTAWKWCGDKTMKTTVIAETEGSKSVKWEIPDTLLDSNKYLVCVENKRSNVNETIHLPIIGKSLTLDYSSINTAYFWEDKITGEIDTNLTANVNSVKVELFKLDTELSITDTTLVNIENDSFEFYIEPDNQKFPEGEYYIKVTDADLLTLSDTSKHFKINPKTITITSPTANDTLIIGRDNNITWESKNVKNFDIQYKKNIESAEWVLITTMNFTNQELNFDYDWAVPNNLTEGSYRIKISDANNPKIAEISDDFYIIKKYIDITTGENDSVTFIAGTTDTIKWNYENIDSVKLLLAQANLDTTIKHKNSDSGSGSYAWKINKNYDFSNEKFIIQDAIDPTFADILFVNVLQDKIIITFPRENDSLIIGQKNKLEWSSPVAKNFRLSLNDTLININGLVESDSVEFGEANNKYEYDLFIPSTLDTGSDYNLVISGSDSENPTKADTVSVTLEKPHIKINLQDSVFYYGVTYPIQLEYSKDLGKVNFYYLYYNNESGSLSSNPSELTLTGKDSTYALKIELPDSIENIVGIRFYVEPQDRGNQALAKDSSEIFSIRQIPIPEIDSSLVADSNLTLLTSSTPKLMWSVGDTNITNFEFRIGKDEDLSLATPKYIAKKDTLIENGVEAGETYYWSIASVVEGVDTVESIPVVGKFKVFNNSDIEIKGLPIVTEVPKTKDKPLLYSVDYGNYVLDTNSLTIGLFLKRGGKPFIFYPAVNDSIIITDNMINPEGIIFIPTLLTNYKDTTFLTKLFYSVQIQSNFSDTINVPKSTASSNGSTTNWHFFGSSIENLTIQNLFSEKLGDTRDPVWRLLEWNNSDSNYVEAENIQNYRGYFFAHTKEDFSININENYFSRSLFDTTMVLDNTFPWSSFANPFIFNVPFYSESGSVIEYDENGNWKLLENGDSLKPFTGYFAQGIDTIKFITNPFVQKHTKNNNTVLWTLDLEIDAGSRKMVRSVSLREPILEKGNNFKNGYKNVNSPPEINNSFVPRLFADNKKVSLLKSECYSNEGGTWSLVLENNTQDKVVTISKKIVGNMPEYYNLLIYNLKNGEIYKEEKVPIFIGKNTSVELKIVIGKQDFIDNQLEQFKESIPVQYSLKQNYPNPFNPSTVIEYSVPEYSLVKIGIYNILGEKINELVNNYKNPGNYTSIWNGNDRNLNKVSSGIYFYSIETDNYRNIKKMILLK